MNYTLVIISSFSDELLESMPAIHADNNMTVQSLNFVSISDENFTVENISTDSAFSFIILISNTVGVVSTKRRAFCEYFSFIPYN